MKKLILLSTFIFLTISSFSQEKYGHIDIQEIFVNLPEYKEFEIKLKEKQTNLENAKKNMTAEAQAIIENYQANEQNMTETEIQDAQVKLNNIQERIALYERTENQSIQKYAQETEELLTKMIKDATNEIAKEGGYTYIFISGTLFYSSPKNDITALVKKKLGI